VSGPLLCAFPATPKPRIRSKTVKNVQWDLEVIIDASFHQSGGFHHEPPNRGLA